MDEPTGGLDVSVQARLLDLLRGLVAELGLAAVIVTHDLAVARLLSHRMMVMQQRPGDRDRADRPGARRSARALHPASRLLGPAGMSHDRAALDRLDGVAKTFTMHLRAASRLPVLRGVDRSRCAPASASCSAARPAPASRSILKMIYGNYRCDAGRILVARRRRAGRRRHRRAARSAARCGARRSAMSASSCAPSRASPRSTSSPSRCVDDGHRRRRSAGARAGELLRPAQPARAALARCRRPPSPAASSSASTSRAASSPTHPILLLDEPTASLDAAQPRRRRRPDPARRKRAGAALLGIFHDEDVRERGRRPRHRRRRFAA